MSRTQSSSSLAFGAGGSSILSPPSGAHAVLSPNYTPKVSFDTFENPVASMFSFTLQVKTAGYRRTRNTRVFLCASSADESGREALDWCLEALVQDGDELIVFRGADEDVFGVFVPTLHTLPTLTSYITQQEKTTTSSVTMHASSCARCRRRAQSTARRASCRLFSSSSRERLPTRSTASSLCTDPIRLSSVRADVASVRLRRG